MRDQTWYSLRLAVLGALLVPSASTAQGSLRVTVPSPTAASLGKFGDVPVSLNTGVPDISVPLFTAKGRTLELPIVLKYHSAGVRVEEIGGWVGMGWTLDAGGAITRTVRGLVDEGPGGYYNNGQVFWTGTNWSTPSVAFLTGIANGDYDGDPDQFFFSFGGRSGEFAMGPIDAAGTKAIRTIPYQKLNIVPQISAAITSWVITAEDGTKYTFGAAETTVDKSPVVILPGHFNETHNSTWHLTQIQAPGGDVITLNYTPYTVTHRMGTYSEKFDFITTTPPACVPSLPIEQRTEHQITVQRLTSITTAAHTITFTPGALRADALSPTGVPQEPTLDLITVAAPLPGGTVIRKFKMVYDYSTGSPPGRLTLKQIFEQDASNVQLPPFAFSYDPMLLPARTSFSVDHWGFYNGKGNSTSIPSEVVAAQSVALTGADRNPDPVFARAGILTKITYPTGGSSQFVYDGNTYGAIGSSASAPVVPGAEQIYAANADLVIPASSQNFTIAGPPGVPIVVDIDVTIVSTCPTGGPGCPIAKLLQGASTLGSWATDTTLFTAFSLIPGVYTLTANATTAGGGSALAHIGAKFRPLGTNYLAPGGGLRVAEVQTDDGMNTPGSVTYTKYNYALATDPTKSSGIINAAPRYSYTFSNPPACAYFSRSSTSKMPLGSGPPVIYRDVAVSRGTAGQFGKTAHHFRSFVEAPDATVLLASIWPYSTATTYEWKRGQTLEATSSNASAQLQRKTTSSYSFRDEGSPDPTTTTRFRGMSINRFGGGFQGATIFAYNPFEVVSAWSYQNAETETIYDETGASSFPTTRSFVYANPNHVQLTELTETNSNGTQRITRMKYPADYTAGSGNPEAVALTAMQGAAVHMHSPVIERWVVEKVGVTERVMRGEITTFKLFGAWYLPFQRFLLNNPVPIQ